MQQKTWLTFRHEAMATHFEILVAGSPEPYARQATAAAFRELDRLEGELSRFVETSDIARANRLARGESTRVGPDTFECLLLAADAALATNRAFDAAYNSTRDPADTSDLAFTLDPATHTITSRVQRLHLDLGAIGKGFALDRMAETLHEWQIESACLNSGGSTALALAAPPDSAGWPVGVGECRVALAHGALSGSGTAVKGEHIGDPRTQRRATRPARVWAFARQAARADALSTAFFVMSDAEITAFCTAHAEIGAATTDVQGQVMTHGRFTALLSSPNTDHPIL